MVSSRNQGSAPGRAARPGDFAARVFIARQFSARPGHAEFEKTYKKWKNYAKFWENETQKVKICKKNESDKNGWIGAQELNWKIFVNSELIIGIYDENYPMKKNLCLSDHIEIFVT